MRTKQSQTKTNFKQVLAMHKCEIIPMHKWRWKRNKENVWTWQRLMQMLNARVNETMINLKQGEHTSKWENDHRTINAQEARGCGNEGSMKNKEKKKMT
jgi:hypothetical protein